MADNLTTFLCAVVMKYGNLNFLEPSGPLQACNGIAFPLPFTKSRNTALLTLGAKDVEVLQLIRS